MTKRYGIPLVTEELIDCFGQRTHTLVLEIDGTVSVTFASSGRTARIEPSTRQVLTPGIQVPKTILDHAASMRLA